ncbi:MAG: universal stress protein [Desulfobacteraceae bacterium]|nr:universal stress protein [Desulfobacteraceae bacterium]
MEKKLLFAVDGSEQCQKAIVTVAALLKDQPGFHVLIYHCLPEVQSLFAGDTAFIAPNGDFLERAGQVVLDKARQALLDVGFPAERITTKLKKESIVPSCDILEEAAASKIRTIVCGRRGKTPKKNLLIGSTSSRVSQYSTLRTVWVVDAPVHDTRRVLIAMEGGPDSRALTYYAAEILAPIPGLEFTLLHLIPKLPPQLWDHGHIPDENEQKSNIEKWRSDTMREVEKFLSEANGALIGRGVPPDKVRTQIMHSREDLARDLLAEIDRSLYQFVLIGKKSFKEKKPFLIGSNANKILKNAKGTILCLVDS